MLCTTRHRDTPIKKDFHTVMQNFSPILEIITVKLM